MKKIKEMKEKRVSRWFKNLIGIGEIKVTIEIESVEKLSDEFYKELSELLAKHTNAKHINKN